VVGLSLQPPTHTGSWLKDFSTLKMEMIRSSETSVHTRSTQRHIPEDGILHSHCCENLKSYIKNIHSHNLNSVCYKSWGIPICWILQWIFLTNFRKQEFSNISACTLV
jgi:hypothetical protein